MSLPDSLPPSSPAAPRPARRRGFVAALGRLFAQGGNDGPPDLEEMWRDFTRKIGNALGFGRKGGASGDGGGSGGGFQPDVRSAGVGVALVAAIVVVVWLFSGSFIVQEGQQAVVTTFGRYSRTVEAGWGWRLPYPFQAHQIENVTQLRTAEVGGSSVQPATGLRDSAMLTQDENIVDVRFSVQYRLSNIRDYLFNNVAPGAAVTQAAESAVREIVGRSRIDAVLYEQRDALPPRLVKSIQAQLDTLHAGILVVNVNVGQVTVPEQVQAEFNDALKAGADSDSYKNEGRAYASDVIPTAQGDAARLREEALAYKARIVGAAEGDADRFKAVLAEYQKAPAVTRDRMYLDAMRDVYSNVTKVMVDTHGGTNLIQLPLDKLGATAPAATPPAAGYAGSTASSSSSSGDAAAAAAPTDLRSRDADRSRDRDGR